uniref:Dynamin N-terminal domain-containing protein n=1 Tax=Salvator merianae TaxID=96440 RepID=A0A8D0BAS3_SALMN
MPAGRGGKPREVANPAAGSAAESITERVLREAHSLYVHPGHGKKGGCEKVGWNPLFWGGGRKKARDCVELISPPPLNFHPGLVSIGARLSLSLLPPRRKVTVMVMGNHSAGKSSFINWYVEEHIQRTGVAIETQGFTFITSGKKRESLTGNATLHLYPHFQALQNFKGIPEYLSTEICTSKQKLFPLITFLDTPGLVDGDMKYPFDVEGSLIWFGQLCDLILVFFDPMGQALCKRTLNIVEKLNESHGDKLHFYLSKADEAGAEGDRQRVLMQIVQELCKRPGLNKCGFDMPTIYIPNSNKPSRCINQIEDVCRTIEKTISQTVQHTLNALERDCHLINEATERLLEEDTEARNSNFRACFRGALLGVVGCLLPIFLLLSLMFGTTFARQLWTIVLGEEQSQALELYVHPVASIWSLVPEEHTLTVFFGLLFLSVVLLLLASYTFKTKPTLTKKQKRQLEDRRDYVVDVVLEKKVDN